MLWLYSRVPTEVGMLNCLLYEALLISNSTVIWWDKWAGRLVILTVLPALPSFPTTTHDCCATTVVWRCSWASGACQRSIPREHRLQLGCELCLFNTRNVMIKMQHDQRVKHCLTLYDHTAHQYHHENSSGLTCTAVELYKVSGSTQDSQTALPRPASRPGALIKASPTP